MLRASARRSLLLLLYYHANKILIPHVLTKRLQASCTIPCMRTSSCHRKENCKSQLLNMGTLHRSRDFNTWAPCIHQINIEIFCMIVHFHEHSHKTSGLIFPPFFSLGLLQYYHTKKKASTCNVMNDIIRVYNTTRCTELQAVQKWHETSRADALQPPVHALYTI